MSRLVPCLLTVLSLALASVQPAGADNEISTIAFVHPHPPVVLSDEADALLTATNAARREQGLAPLRRDASLDAFAANYGRTMAIRRFFGHTAPDGTTFRDRLREAHVAYQLAEENIALDRDVNAAHAAFLGSPGHRENLLNPDVRRIGVAVVSGGDEENLYVEEFAR